MGVLAIKLCHCSSCKGTLRQEKGNPLRKPLTRVYQARGYTFFLPSFFKNHKYNTAHLQLYSNQTMSQKHTPSPVLKLSLRLKQHLRDCCKTWRAFSSHPHSLLQSSSYYMGVVENAKSNLNILGIAVLDVQLAGTSAAVMRFCT